MEVSRLLTDELTYELHIRGLPTTGPVQEKRTLLRDALRMERLGQAQQPSTVALDPEQEFIICEAKLKDLQQDVVEFDESNRENEFKRIKSRIRRINQRIGGINVCSKSTLKTKQLLLNKCLDLLRDLSLAYAGVSAFTSQSDHISAQASGHSLSNPSHQS